MNKKASSEPSTPPLVSVIMPVYNCQKYLVTALDSIVNQTYTNLEIIVVEDGSTDNTWQVLKDYATKDARIHAFRNKQNLKIVATLNLAISHATGKYLARMDGDDIRVLDSIERQVAYLEAHPQVVMVGGPVDFCDEEMRRLNSRAYPQTDAEIRKKLFRYSPFCHACLVFRASAVEPDPYKLNWAEDYDLYFRLAKKGQMANLDNLVYKVRTHKASVSRSKTRYQEKLTLYLRLKAVFEYGYTMTTTDKLYLLVQLGTMYFTPSNFRFWFFNKIRAIKT